MTTVSLVGVASYMPEKIIDNSFFDDGDEATHIMFRGAKLRHHVGPHETAVAMMQQATDKLAERLNLNFAKDTDIILTNVTCPDMPFTGSGAGLAYALGCKPQWILDLHNGGCVSFILMMACARSLMHTFGAKTALLCNVQNAAGRIFGQPENRKRKQSRIPGDGCGVGFLIANEECPVRSIVQRNYGEYASDMKVTRDDGTDWWEPSLRSAYIDFSDSKIASVLARGNRIVPEVIFEACRQAGLPLERIGTLVTNQPNRLFLRNWREAVQVSRDVHVETFERHGNLFGAALPICMEEAINTNRLKANSHLVMGGFAHAGDCAAAAVIHWQPG